MRYLMARTVRVMGRIGAASVVSGVDEFGWVQIIMHSQRSIERWPAWLLEAA